MLGGTRGRQWRNNRRNRVQFARSPRRTPTGRTPTGEHPARTPHPGGWPHPPTRRCARTPGCATMAAHAARVPRWPAGGAMDKKAWRLRMWRSATARLLAARGTVPWAPPAGARPTPGPLPIVRADRAMTAPGAPRPDRGQASDAAVDAAPGAWPARDSGWSESSWELRQGLWVVEADESAWHQACGATVPQVPPAPPRAITSWASRTDR